MVDMVVVMDDVSMVGHVQEAVVEVVVGGQRDVVLLPGDVLRLDWEHVDHGSLTKTGVGLMDVSRLEDWKPVDHGSLTEEGIALMGHRQVSHEDSPWGPFAIPGARRNLLGKRHVLLLLRRQRDEHVVVHGCGNRRAEVAWVIGRRDRTRALAWVHEGHGGRARKGLKDGSRPEVVGLLVDGWLEHVSRGGRTRVHVMSGGNRFWPGPGILGRGGGTMFPMGGGGKGMSTRLWWTWWW